ncbi:hypothetical protein DFQ27_009654, partial [Actinomortierella ambigua]
MRGLNILHLPTLLALSVVTTAPTVPVPSSRAAYARFKDKFYIFGGTTASTETRQFFALDLSKSWESESPAWINLPPGPQVSFPRAAISPDGKAFVSFPSSNGETHRFLFERTAWVPSKLNYQHAFSSAYPVTLGADGSAILVEGLQGVEGVDENVYILYSFETDRNVTLPLPTDGIEGIKYLPREGYKAVWSEHLQSAIFHGGSRHFGSPKDLTF